jgi:cation diffusion facilitator family transporter
MSGEETTGTVVVALVANLVIALAKIVAGLLGGSSAMLAEGAHSVADTTNQVFLLASLRRSRRPADETHPFGYGKERFFWSLLAAVGIFVSGGMFSLYEGVHTLVAGGGEAGGHYLLSYAVLVVAFVAEGASWLRAVHQLRREAQAAERSLVAHVRLSPDPTVKTVVSEDSAALVGVVLAAAGVALHQLTGSAFWDGAAAIAIGLLLVYVAFLLGRDTKELLIGEAAEPGMREALRSALAGYRGVDAVLEVLTMQLGPDALLVAARLDMEDTFSAGDVEELVARIEADLRDAFPVISELFLAVSRRPPQVAWTTPADSSASSSPPTSTR